MDKEKNEVMEGYKETEIGLLPADWEVVRMGNVTTIIRDTINPSNYPEEVFDYYSIPAYQENGRAAYEIGKNIKSQKLVVEANDVLFGKLNPRVPKVWFVVNSEKRKITSTEFIPLRVVHETISAEYLYYLCWSDYVMPKAQELVSGSTPSRQRVDVSAFISLVIPLPPLPEQRKIAHVLSTIQKAIEIQDKVISALRELKKSLMRHLFTYGPVPVDQIDRVPLKETEIGMVPEHWEVVRLGEVSNFTQKPRNLDFSGDVPFIPMELVPIGRVNIQGYIIKHSSEISSGVYCEQGDLLLAKITPSFENYKQGIISEIPRSYAFATTEVYPIKAKKDLIEILYLFYYLLIPRVREDIAGKMEGTTGRKRVSKSVILNYLIPLPPPSEQRQIAHILTIVDNKITSEQQRKSTLQSLFQTMLHLLMTGKVRVKDLEVKEDALRQ